MLNSFKSTRAWHYPTAFGIVVGVLVAGIGFRLTAQPRTTAAQGLTAPGAAGGAGGTTSGPDQLLITPGAQPSAGPVRPTSAAVASSTSGAAGTTGGSAGGGTGVIASGPKLSATDIGVTATSIRVGVAILTAGQFGNLVGGNPDPNVVKGVWNTYFDAINKAGGVQGRKIVPYYQVVDVTDSNSQQAACNTWVQTDKVFMVFGGDAVSQTGQLCLALQNHTILSLGASTSGPEEYYRQSGYRMISQAANSTRGLAEWALALDRLHKLQGQKIGLMYIDGDTATTQGLIPTLKRLGYTITYTAVLSSDLSQQGSQAVAAATQMQAHGVTFVMSSQLGFLGLQAFVQGADKQEYKPHYSAVGGGVDSAFFLKGMPKSFQGAITVTAQLFTSPPHPVDPVTAACKAQYRKLGGPAKGLDSSNIQFLLAACGGSHLLSMVGSAVGPDLTRNAFVSSVQSLGSSFNWYASLGGSFAPGRTDYNTNIRAMVFEPSDGSTNNCNGDNPNICWNDLGQAFNPGV